MNEEPESPVAVLYVVCPDCGCLVGDNSIHEPVCPGRKDGA